MLISDFIYPLTEKMIDRLGEDGRLFLNPSRAEMRSLSNVTEFRMLLDPYNNDLYVWDAYYATHGAIKDRYSPDGFHLVYYPKESLVIILTLWRYERKGFTLEQVYSLVSENPTLKHILPKYRILIKESK